MQQNLISELEATYFVCFSVDLGSVAQLLQSPSDAMISNPKTVISRSQYAVPHPPFPVDGNGSFSNLVLTASILGAPVLVVRFIPFLSLGFWSYIFLVLLCGLPVTVAYWQIMSVYGSPVRDNIKLPGKPVTDYIDFKDPELKKEYALTGKKIPMQIAYDAYFDQKLDFKGECS